MDLYLNVIFKNAEISKPPQTPTEIFNTWVFHYICGTSEGYLIARNCPLLENLVTSQGYKSYAKNRILDVSLKIEAFTVIVYNISFLHHTANKINFHITNFFLSFYELWMATKTIFSAPHLSKENFRQYLQQKLKELDVYETLFCLHWPNGKAKVKVFHMEWDYKSNIKWVFG